MKAGELEQEQPQESIEDEIPDESGGGLNTFDSDAFERNAPLRGGMNGLNGMIGQPIGSGGPPNDSLNRNELPSIWRANDITPEQSLMYHLGPLEVILSRRAKEFRFYYTYSEQQLWACYSTIRRIATQQWYEAREKTAKTDMYERYRITGYADADHCAIRLSGRCADLPVVARPSSQVQIARGGVVDVYVTTPVWVEFEEAVTDRVIHSLPTWNMKRTWFGPADGPGPLCYLSVMKASLNYEDVKTYAMRVITHIVIQNDGPLMALDRIVIPAPLLQVYHNDRGELWTESITILRASDGTLTKVKVKDRPPQIAGTCNLLSGRREKLVDPLLFPKLVQSLFSH